MVMRRSRFGIHLFDRRTGLNILLDEIKVPAAQWHHAPRYVSIALTNACELRCPYCYAPKTPGRLLAADVVRWCRELDGAGCLGVGLGGGEPTAHPDLVALCRQISMETQLAVSMTTHAHRFDAEMASALRGHVHFIRVSIDGVSGTYERLRGRPFDRLRRQLELVASIAPHGINVVVNADTVVELDQVAKLAAASGATELLLLPEQRTATTEGIDERTEATLVDWIDQRPAGMSLAISRARVPNGVPIADPFPGEAPIEAHAHVDANGTLKTDAYATHGILIGERFLDALSFLERETL